MNLKLLITIIFLLPFHAYAEKWYESDPAYKVFAELTLKAGELKKVKIKAKGYTMVGFWAKITPKEMEYYKSINIKPITVHYAPEKITMFGYGGGQVVIPVNGEINLEIKNNSKEKILVDMYEGKYVFRNQK